jgi:hypothetical protein
VGGRSAGSATPLATLRKRAIMMGLAIEQEVVVPFSAPQGRAGPVYAVRSTLLSISMKSLRDRGLYERYLENLSGRHRQTILGTIAGEWLDVEAAFAHYEACDALGLSTQEQRQIGEDVGEKQQRTFFSFLVRAAKAAGVTPWTALEYVHGARERGFKGGDVSVVKVGPKEVRVTITGLLLVGIPYFRHGMIGAQAAALRLFANRIYVRDISRGAPPSTFTTLISWV